MARDTDEAKPPSKLLFVEIPHRRIGEEKKKNDKKMARMDGVRVNNPAKFKVIPHCSTSNLKGPHTN